jgi:hypothetical protein
VFRQLTQVCAVEIHGHGNVLLSIGEFAEDLLLQQCTEFRFVGFAIIHDGDDTAGQMPLSPKVMLTQDSFP